MESVSKKAYFRFLETIPDPAFVVDGEGRIVMANSNAHSTFGFSNGEMNGQALDSHIPRWRRKKHKSQVKGYFDDPHIRHMGSSRVFSGIRKDGSKFPMDIMLSPVTIDGTPYAICVARDITERLRPEEEFTTIIQTALDGFWIVDTQGHFLTVNDAYCDMVGYTRRELLTMRIHDIEATESSDQIESRIEKIMNAGSDRFETRHRCKDGKIIDIEVSANYGDYVLDRPNNMLYNYHISFL